MKIDEKSKNDDDESLIRKLNIKISDLERNVEQGLFEKTNFERRLRETNEKFLLEQKKSNDLLEKSKENVELKKNIKSIEDEK